MLIHSEYFSDETIHFIPEDILIPLKKSASYLTGVEIDNLTSNEIRKAMKFLEVCLFDIVSGKVPTQTSNNMIDSFISFGFKPDFILRQIECLEDDFKDTV